MDDREFRLQRLTEITRELEENFKGSVKILRAKEPGMSECQVFSAWQTAMIAKLKFEIELVNKKLEGVELEEFAP